MKSIRILTTATLAIALSSCAPSRPDGYDAVPPAGTSNVNAPLGATANPVYDTPAAYEAASGAGPAAQRSAPNLPATPNKPARPTAATAAPVSNGAATIHTVVAGDTLSGIAAKYKTSSAAIKTANNMTKDTVVLGRKMVIPPK